VKETRKMSKQFNVIAPSDGMIVYERYINEIDVNRIKVGQKVSLKADALPDKTYTGEVIYIGNIGQQRPGFDAKVFDVKIQIQERDSLLRPSMTTANSILTDSHQDVTYVPLEALHSYEDVNFVFMDKNKSSSKQGWKKMLKSIFPFPKIPMIWN